MTQSAARHRIAPAELPFAQDVGSCQRVFPAERGILNERRRRIEGLIDRENGGQLLVIDPDEGRSQHGRIDGFRGHRCDRLAGELRLANREHRSIVVRRSVSRNRLRQIGSGHHAPYAVDSGGRGRVDAPDACPGAAKVNELDLQRIVEMYVRDIALCTSHPLDAADARDRPADPVFRHPRSDSAAARTASMIRL